jgi:hypothetical protein
LNFTPKQGIAMTTTFERTASLVTWVGAAEMDQWVAPDGTVHGGEEAIRDLVQTGEDRLRDHEWRRDR